MDVFLNNYHLIVLSSVLVDSGEECCREKGVPDVCFGYCIRKGTPAVDRTGIRGTLLITQICEKWFDEIGECRPGNIYSLLII